jgi:hypothetical protein
MSSGLIECTSAISSSLPPAGKFGFELVGGVEVVFDGALVAAGDEDHLANSGRVGFFDRVLDQRLVHHGQHFLGAGLGGWQEACAETGDREDRFLNRQTMFLCRHDEIRVG